MNFCADFQDILVNYANVWPCVDISLIVTTWNSAPRYNLDCKTLVFTGKWRVSPKEIKEQVHYKI